VLEEGTKEREVNVEGGGGEPVGPKFECGDEDVDETETGKNVSASPLVSERDRRCGRAERECNHCVWV
jgi:hypothetical protein